MGGDTLNLKIDSSVPFSLKRLHAKIVMHLVIFRWLCLRGFYGISRILVTYLSLFSRHASFNSLAVRAPVSIMAMSEKTEPRRER